MTQLMNRRAVLKTGLAGMIGLSFSPLANGADQILITELSEAMHLLSGFGGNILVQQNSEGLVLVDSGAGNNISALLNTLSEISGSKKVHTIFNSHWHLDQIGGNEHFGDLGATIIAHEKTRFRLATDYYLPQEDRFQVASPLAAQPTETFHTTGSLAVDKESIEYGYLQQAHTDGDIYVYFREANVLAVGDVVSPIKDPEFDWFGGGWIGGRIDALTLLLDMSNEQTVMVPSYGPVVKRADILAERELMQVIYDRMVDLIREGYSARDIFNEGFMDGLSRQWNDPYKFLYDAHKGLWAHHNKLEPNIV